MDLISQGDMFGLIGVYSYVASVLLIARLLAKRNLNSRKFVHIMTGGIVFIWWSFDSKEIMAGLAAFPFIPILMLVTPISPFKKLRKSALGTISKRGHEYGLVMYAVSWTLIAYFLFENLLVASVAIVSMSFGDGFGELIGRKFGRRRYLPNRTVEGTVAVYTATLVSILIIGWFYVDIIGYEGLTRIDALPAFSMITAGFVACLEAITPGRIDNLIIPLSVGGYLHLLGVIA